MSLFACKALQLPAAIGVKARHLSREVAERGVTVLLDERVDAGLSAEIRVLLARVHRAVEVGLALTPPRDESLGVQSPKDRHVGRIRAWLLSPPVQRLHDLAHGDLAIAAPDVLHHLGLELVQLRRRLLLRTHYDAV